MLECTAAGVQYDEAMIADALISAMREDAARLQRDYNDMGGVIVAPQTIKNAMIFVNLAETKKQNAEEEKRMLKHPNHGRDHGLLVGEAEIPQPSTLPSRMDTDSETVLAAALKTGGGAGKYTYKERMAFNALGKGSDAQNRIRAAIAELALAKAAAGLKVEGDNRDAGRPRQAGRERGPRREEDPRGDEERPKRVDNRKCYRCGIVGHVHLSKKCKKTGNDLPHRPKEHAMIASTSVGDEFDWDDEAYFDVDTVLVVSCQDQEMPADYELGTPLSKTDDSKQDQESPTARLCRAIGVTKHRTLASGHRHAADQGTWTSDTFLSLFSSLRLEAGEASCDEILMTLPDEGDPRRVGVSSSSNDWVDGRETLERETEARASCKPNCPLEGSSPEFDVRTAYLNINSGTVEHPIPARRSLLNAGAEVFTPRSLRIMHSTRYTDDIVIHAFVDSAWPERSDSEDEMPGLVTCPSSEGSSDEESSEEESTDKEFNCEPSYATDREDSSDDESGTPMAACAPAWSWSEENRYTHEIRVLMMEQEGPNDALTYDEKRMIARMEGRLAGVFASNRMPTSNEVGLQTDLCDPNTALREARNPTYTKVGEALVLKGGPFHVIEMADARLVWGKGVEDRRRARQSRSEQEALAAAPTAKTPDPSSSSKSPPPVESPPTDKHTQGARRISLERVSAKLRENAVKSGIERGQKSDKSFRMDGALDEESKRLIDDYFESVDDGGTPEPPLRESAGGKPAQQELISVEKKAAALNAAMVANGSDASMIKIVEQMSRGAANPINTAKVKKEPRSAPAKSQIKIEEGARKSLRNAGQDPPKVTEEDGGWHIDSHRDYRGKREERNKDVAQAIKEVSTANAVAYAEGRPMRRYLKETLTDDDYRAELRRHRKTHNRHGGAGYVRRLVDPWETGKPFVPAEGEEDDTEVSSGEGDSIRFEESEDDLESLAIGEEVYAGTHNEKGRLILAARYSPSLMSDQERERQVSLIRERSVIAASRSPIGQHKPEPALAASASSERRFKSKGDGTVLMTNEEDRAADQPETDGPTLGTRHSVWIDTGSPKHVFRDDDLLHSKRAIAAVTLGGIDAEGEGVTAVEAGCFVTVEGVLCCPQSSANILSFALLQTQGHRISYEPERDLFGVRLKNTIKTIIFRRWTVDGVRRRHYGAMCTKRPEETVLAVTENDSDYQHPPTREEAAAAKRNANLTVSEQLRKYTKDEVRRALAARQQQAILGFVSPSSHLVTIKAGDIKNNPVTAEDVARAHDIWGKVPAFMRGKARYTKAVAAHLSKLPVTTQQQQEMQIDIFWWDRLVFLFGILVPMRMPFSKLLPDRSADSIEVALTSFLSSCQENNIDVVAIRSDNEGGVEALRQPLQALGVKLEPAGPGKHAPDAENGIKILKEIARAAKHSVKWRLPKIVVVASIAFATLAMALSRSQLNPHIPPPLTQFCGMQMDYKLHPTTKFGAMAYAEVVETNNTSDTRSTPVIVLYPIMCNTKKVAVWDLESDRVLERSGRVTIVPTTEECIRFINAKHDKEVSTGKISPHTFDESEEPLTEDGAPPAGTAPNRITVTPDAAAEYDPLAPTKDAEVQPRRVRFAAFDSDALGRTRSSTAAARAAAVAEGIKGVTEHQIPTPAHSAQELRVPARGPRVPAEGSRVQQSALDVPATLQLDAPPSTPARPDASRWAHGTGVSSPHYWTAEAERGPAQMMGGYVTVDPSTQPTPTNLAGEFSLPVTETKKEPYPTKTHPKPPPKPPSKPPSKPSNAANELAAQSRNRREQDTDDRALVLTIKQGVDEFGDLALTAISGELKQMLTKKVWRPVHWKEMTAIERKRVIPSSMFLKEKKDSAGKTEKIKARLVAGGHRQDKTLYSDLSSPTVSTTSVFAVAAIAAKEGRLCEVADIPGAYLLADLKAVVHMALDKVMADELCKLEPSYSQYRDERGRIAVRLLKALYGCVESAKLWYDDLRTTLCGAGYSVNPEDPCVFNLGKGEGQSTILLHVDDLMVSCRHQATIDALWRAIETRYKTKLVFKKGSVLSYLGMSLDFSTNGEVAITQKGFTDEMLAGCGIDLAKGAATPASDNLFVVREDAAKITEVESVWFHRVTAQMLYLAKRTRPETLTAVAFLVTRVTKSDQDDVNKLKRLLLYVNGTRERGIVLRPGAKGVQLRIFVDAAYGVHSDGRSASGSVISLGDAGPIHVKSSKQKIVTKSSTEAELVTTLGQLQHPLPSATFLDSTGAQLRASGAVPGQLVVHAPAGEGQGEFGKIEAHRNPLLLAEGTSRRRGDPDRASSDGAYARQHPHKAPTG